MRFFLWLLSASLLSAAYLDFDLYKRKGAEAGDTLLVFGGIHGDEPGGYFAASVLVEHYRISKGNLWIAPNLNFDSIVRHRRGIYGDMNRKFAEIDKEDNDFKSIARIKALIIDPEVDLILNLHDGHGFYRKEWKNAIFNPAAWGQTCIIDQKCITAEKYANLDEIATAVSEDVNKVLAQNHHSFGVKNTKTKFKDEQMRLSMTYFAVRHAKAAFAIETSKNISDLNQKVYYQLQAIEAYMRVMGIEFSRDFNLTRQEVAGLLKPHGTLNINEKIILELAGLRSTLNYVPMKRSGNGYEATHPLGALYPTKYGFDVNIGDQRITRIRPQYFTYDDTLQSVTINVDDVNKSVAIPSVVDVNSSFTVYAPEDYRVNVIGFSQKGYENENALRVTRDALQSRFSLDNQARLFRVEVYKAGKFCGMVVVRFPLHKEP